MPEIKENPERLAEYQRNNYEHDLKAYGIDGTEEPRSDDPVVHTVSPQQVERIGRERKAFKGVKHE